ncbi:MAG TPA: uroporphyrinogen-III C-methyltransferase [Gammaproteobacteria bacterium]
MTDSKQPTDAKSTAPADAATTTSAEKSVKRKDTTGKHGATGADSSALAVSDEKQAKPQHTTPARPLKQRVLPWLGGFGAVIIAVLGAGNFWLYQQGQQLKQLIERVPEQQNSQDNEINALKQNSATLQDQQQSLALKAEQNEMEQRSLLGALEQLSLQIKALAAEKGKEPLYWRVSEVEYLLTLANQRVALERDVVTALSALQDADNRLRIIADPGLIPVREKISREINQLNNVSLPDVPGMAAQLRSVLNALDQLPLEKKTPALVESAAEAPREFTGAGNFLKTVWQDLVNGLFRIQRSDQPIEPLLPPEEKFYLVYNLELKLEQARIALLNHDSALFRLNLEDVAQWAGDYFDKESAAVSNLLQVVSNLKQVELRPPLPDISASLRELRSWLEKQQKNVAYRQQGPASSQLALSTDEARTP